jgi:hypothetical protein
MWLNKNRALTRTETSSETFPWNESKDSTYSVNFCKDLLEVSIDFVIWAASKVGNADLSSSAGLQCCALLLSLRPDMRVSRHFPIDANRSGTKSVQYSAAENDTV